MNRKKLAIDAGALLGGAALVVGAHVAATSVADGARHAARIEAARPRPTTTQVVTEPPTTPPRPPEHPRNTPTASPTVGVTERTEDGGQGATGPQQGGGGYAVTSTREQAPGASRPGPGTPSGPRPSAPTTSTAPRCLLGLTAAELRACVALGR